MQEKWKEILFRVGFYLEEKLWKQTVEKGKKPGCMWRKERALGNLREQAAMIFRSF